MFGMVRYAVVQTYTTEPHTTYLAGSPRPGTALLRDRERLRLSQFPLPTLFVATLVAVVIGRLVLVIRLLSLSRILW